MVEQTLHGRRILVVEDEYLLAAEVSSALSAAGAEVLGPVACVEDAAAMTANETQIDAAVLDISLRGALVFPVADTLAGRDVPFVFTTGYDRSALPERFLSRPRLEKPFQAAKVVSVLVPMLSAASARH